MGELEILHELVQQFEKFQLPYLLTGGYAVTYYGVPRATNDIDFLIEITAESKKALLNILDNLSSAYIFDKQFVAQSGDKITEFNVVHGETGIKIDFWITPRPDFKREFEKRREVKIGSSLVLVVAPEDLILTKLRWCKEIFSERHFTDCQGIFQIQKGKLDIAYLKKEARKLEVLNLLEEVAL